MNASFPPGIRTWLVLGKTKIIFQGTFRDNGGSEMVGTYPVGSENFQSSRVFRMFLGCFWCFQKHWAGFLRTRKDVVDAPLFVNCGQEKWSKCNSHGTPSEVDIHNSSRRLSCLVTQEWHRLIHLIPSIYKKFGPKQQVVWCRESLTNLPGIKMNGDGYK